MESKDSSCPLVVEKLEVILVKPSKPTPDVSLSLSTIDNDPFYEFIVQTIAVFAPEPGIEDEANYDPASLLKHALSDPLSYYYPLAGKLHRKSDDNRLQLNYKAGDGVPLISATAACTLSSLNDLDSDSDAAYQLVPCSDFRVGVEEYDPLTLQVTKFACGGITIGFAYCHSVCDGAGMAQFIRAMIELASGQTQPTVIPVWERERLTFNGKLEGKIVDFQGVGSSFATSSRTLTGDIVREIVNITSEDITKLKEIVANDEKITNETGTKMVVTTLEILAAYVWRARCRAMNLSPYETTVLSIAIDIRNIMEPPLPKGYYGNAIINGDVALTAMELNDSSLSCVVKLIKDMKTAALDNRYVLERLCEIERKLKMKASLEGIGGGTMMLSDWRKLGLHYDGWGGLLNIIPLIPLTNSNICVLLPASKAVPEMSGGVRVLVTLPRDAIEKFKEEMTVC